MLLNIKISNDFTKEVHLVAEALNDMDIFMVKCYDKGVLESKSIYTNIYEAINDYDNTLTDGDSNEH